MAGVNVNVSEVTAALRTLRGRYRALEPALADIGEYLRLSHDQRFRDQKSPEGDPWVALSAEYKKRKGKLQDRILRLDGHLQDEPRYVIYNDALYFGTDRVYGATHQLGDDDRNIPARPFLGLSTEDVQEVSRLVSEHLFAAGLGHE